MITETQLINKLTYEDYLAYDEGTEIHYELEDGVLVEMPTESKRNSSIAKRLLAYLLNYFSIDLLAYKDTEIAVLSSEVQCRLPDLIIHTPASIAAMPEENRGIILFDMPAPAVIVEVVSPGAENRQRDYDRKHKEYASRGIPEYWIIDPELQQITICKLIDQHYQDEVIKGENCLISGVVPDFALTVNQILGIS